MVDRLIQMLHEATIRYSTWACRCPKCFSSVIRSELGLIAAESNIGPVL